MIPLGAADVAEQVVVLIALQLADQLSAAGSQAGDDSVDVVDHGCEVADARGVGRRVRVAALTWRRVGTSVRSLVVPAPWSLMDAGTRDGAPLICCGVVWVSAVA
jgi:hypothetical protein